MRDTQVTDRETDEMFIDTVTQNYFSETEQAFANIQIENQAVELKFKLDTGAQVNVVSLHEYHTLQDECELQPTSHRLTGYGGQQLTVKGKCRLKCRYKERNITSDFYVVDTLAPPVLGFRACLDLGLIKLVLSVSTPVSKQSIMKEYANVFKGI